MIFLTLRTLFLNCIFFFCLKFDCGGLFRNIKILLEVNECKSLATLNLHYRRCFHLKFHFVFIATRTVEINTSNI